MWYLRRSRFADALAQLRTGGWPRSGRDLWACYRLNMYDTVARGAWDGQHLQGGVAMAASLAACERLDEATEAARRVSARLGEGPLRSELIRALAPFLPDLALTLVAHDDAHIALRAALLLRVNEREQAARLLQAALEQPGPHPPELHLLNANALDEAPLQQLVRLNAYLAAFKLSPLALVDKAFPPCATNLASATDLPAVRGPLVSVLMTAHNTAARIGPALSGLLAQTWQDLEVVVVDDASSDHTVAVVEAAAARDARVKLVRLPRNAGTYVAKTVGLWQAAGEFVTCHDSDDWSHPLRLERQMRPLMANPRLVASTSSWVRMDDNGAYFTRLTYPLTRLNPASPLFRKQAVIERAGLWDAVRSGADSEFLARLKLVFGRQAVHRVAQPLTLGAHRADSLMTAKDTGYAATGVSPSRLAYWENWTRWHIESLRAGRQPVMPSLRSLMDRTRARPFLVPDGMEVDRAVATAYLEAAPATET